MDSNEPVHKTLLGLPISESRNILIARQFLESLMEKYGKYSVYSDSVVLDIQKSVRY